MKRIELRKGEFTLVDDDIYEWASQLSWFNRGGYACTNYIGDDGKVKDARLHRMVLKSPSDKWVDHINGDKLDNRRVNLRLCNPRQNQHNKRGWKNSSSKYKGVCKKKDKREVSVRPEGKYKYLGRFSNEVAAANCYNYYAKVYYGEFAWINEVPKVMSKDEFEKFKS